MNMQIPRMQDLDLQGLRTMIRLDLNVPIENGVITSAARIQAALPTVEIALSKGATVILLSHLGRPDPEALDGSFSLEPVARKLEELMGKPVCFLADWIEGIPDINDKLILCENTRYLKGEKTNDESLSKQIANLCDVYVMDAFGASHRQHASTFGVVQYAEQACIGPLLSREIEYLTKALSEPEKPLVAIIGGAKISSKLGVIESLSKTCDQIIVGGAIANTFLLAEGKETGKSLIEPEMVGPATRILNLDGVNVPIPIDVTVAKEFSNEAIAETKSVEEIEKDDVILDIGPETAIIYKDIELIIEYSFKNKENLKNSLIHPSSYKDKKNKPINHLYEFERLEFLGDKILGLSIASLIFYKFNDFNEGALTKKLSYLVQRNFLYKINIEYYR